MACMLPVRDFDRLSSPRTCKQRKDLSPEKKKNPRRRIPQTSRNKMEGKSAVAELEGALLEHDDLFPYFMLVAFEASGLIRFAFLLILWPVLYLLRASGKRHLALRLMVFVSLAGVPAAEIEAVARSVLPKFLLGELNFAAWRAFAEAEKRVVVTAMPRLMVDWFAREHLGATEVVGAEIRVCRFGFAVGLLKKQEFSVAERVRGLFGHGEKPSLGLTGTPTVPFLALCQEQKTSPVDADRRSKLEQGEETPKPKPVIFHDGRLVPFPTPRAALLILLWLPLGIFAALLRILTGVFVPLRFHPHLARPFGGALVIRGSPPPPHSGGVLFVCTHRSLLDPVVLATALGRTVPAVTYSISRLSELLSPIPTVRLTRDRKLDADRIKSELSRGDLVVCPEGTTCREPFLLRFSALFAELTDRIVPVAMNCRVGMFHATTARGWKALDPVFFFMNPRPIYEVTFLEQLPKEETCAGGKSAHEVANHVQRILAEALGYECTEFTRKDKYRRLAGNDGTVKLFSPPWRRRGGLRRRATSAFTSHE